MKVNILRANNGDATLIQITNNENVNKNILIDGGTSRTYNSKNKKGKIEQGDLQKVINEIYSKNEFIDLLIITHIDDDHIGGIIKWIEADPKFKDIVKEIWFNSGEVIGEYYKLKNYNNNNNVYINESTTDTSVKQGIKFEKYLSDAGIWSKKLFKSGQIETFYELEFHILTPNETKLKKLLDYWTKNNPEPLTSKKNDYKNTLSELVNNDTFEEDDAIPNGSSISFILKYKDINLIFLGDAHPSDVAESLTEFGYSEDNAIKCEIIKVSHHGSKYNTSKELLNLIDCESFIISSNGETHNLPDKLCLARIINSKTNPIIYFNYPELIEIIFKQQDYKDYNFKAEGINKEFVF